MALAVHNVTFDCKNPLELARFWATALNYEVAAWSDVDGAAASDPNGKGPRLLFMPVPEDKVVKNRLHLDVTPDVSMETEVRRLLELGASVVRRMNVSEGPWTGIWTIMADPEGNEFCVEPGSQDEKQ